MALALADDFRRDVDLFLERGAIPKHSVRPRKGFDVGTR
jgi:hypothetical protein